MTESIYFDYYNQEKPEMPFSQITIQDKFGEKISTINLDIPRNEFMSIFLALKDCSPDKRFLEWKEW